MFLENNDLGIGDGMRLELQERGLRSCRSLYIIVRILVFEKF